MWERVRDLLARRKLTVAYLLIITVGATGMYSIRQEARERAEFDATRALEICEEGNRAREVIQRALKADRQAHLNSAEALIAAARASGDDSSAEVIEDYRRRVLAAVKPIDEAVKELSPRDCLKGLRG